jgi:hypothetical protein
VDAPQVGHFEQIGRAKFQLTPPASRVRIVPHFTQRERQ